VWTLVPAGQAQAHALLVRSDPPVNARLQEPPTAVTGFFSEPLDTRLSSLHVVSGEGERVDAGDTSFGPDPTQMSAKVSGQLPPGFYTAVWETLSSADGHLLKGSFPFTVLNPDGSEPSGPMFAGEAGYSGAAPKWDNVTTKWVGLTAAAALVGSLAFVVWVVRPASKDLSEQWKKRAREAARRRLAWLAWPAIGILALVGGAELLVQVRQLGGPSFIGDVLRNDWGTRWIQRQLVLVAIAVAFFIAARLWRAGHDRLSESALWVALASGLGYLVLVAMISHGFSVPGSFWAVAADFAHLAASSVWIGMLAQLALFLVWSRQLPSKERPAVVASHLQRFSVIAATSVIVLLASGAVNGLTHIPVPEAMFDTAYGRALTVKLGIMAALLVVAGVNAIYLRPRLVEERDGTERLSRRLSFVLRAEIGLALAVLLVAAVLVQYVTARQDRAAEANVQTSAQAVTGFEEIQTASDVSIDLSVAPNAVGTNSYRVFLFPTQGNQIGGVQRVRLRFKPPDITLGESQVVADPAGLNAYKAVGPFLSQPGKWEVNVDLRRVQRDDVTALFRLDVTGTGPQAGGGRFALPLVVGSWATVGSAGVLLASLLAAVWAAQWPRLPLPALRTLRVGRVTGAVLGLGLLAGALWFAPLNESTSGNPIKPSGDSIAIGRSFYIQNCAKCHGDSGHGDGPLASQLAVPPADFRIHIPYHSDRFFFQVISNGLGGVMPPFGGLLTKEQRWHLINFLKAEFGLNAQSSGQ